MTTLVRPRVTSSASSASDAAGDGARAAAPRSRPRRPRLRVPVLGWGGLAAAVVLVVVAVAAIAPGLLTGVDPLAADPLAALAAPSAEHLAGTDSLGRDVLARIIHGARYSLTIGLAATTLAALGGILLGLLAGSGNRVLDTVVARAVDVLASFPEILLALVLIAFTGPGLGNLIVAIGIAGIPRFARVVRAQTQVVRTSGYVEQARTFGLTGPRLALRHVLPNALATVPVLATIGLGGAIIGAAGLSFLGLGPQPPTPEWGAMLAENRNYLRVAWWGAVFPGLAVVLTVVSATVLGRAVQRHLERSAA
ncbi:peptide ABC transporter permease [Serinibacter arcticus]|uniref:Peptide ABC transporter permease n=1 Tax=Serinibacter arcticus TaxID=1655435 RepID=A0A2U1ZVD0_9MICO|nr:ABC transporter permease [Serinibacter arcticus]PWD50921.1 peptide ABC transporter permease [Serinibacter arcticus]